MAANDLQTTYGNLYDQIKRSPTAYAPNTSPTSKDLGIALQIQSVKKQIEKMRSDQLRMNMYGKKDTSTDQEVTPPPDKGWISKGLEALQKPVNAVAGAAQYTIGKGAKTNLFDNINEATKTGLTFGNVLQQTGVPWGVAAPVGFALDLVADPVNWITAGTAALVPRIGAGLARGFMKKAGTEVVESGLEGALKGGLTGLTSNLEKKAATAMNLVPFAKRSVTYKNLADDLGKKAIKGSEEYDRLVGTSVYEQLGKNAFGLGKTGQLGNWAESQIRKVPSVKILGKSLPSGDTFADFMKYSPKQASDAADVKDSARNFALNAGAKLERNAKNADFSSAEEFLSPGATITRNMPENTANSVLENAEVTINQQVLPMEGISDPVKIRIRDDQGVLLPEFKGSIKIADTKANAQTFLDIASEDNKFSYKMKDLDNAYRETPAGKTGVKGFDDYMDRIKATTIGDLKNFKLGNIPAVDEEVADNIVNSWNLTHALDLAKNKAVSIVEGVKGLSKPGAIDNISIFGPTIEALETTTSIFKAAVVPLNVGSHVVAIVGNLFMGAMTGLPVYKKEYLNSLWKASGLLKGRLGADGLIEMFFNDANMLIEMAEKNPSRFKEITGINAFEIHDKLALAKELRVAIKQTKEGLLAELEEGYGYTEKGEEAYKKFETLEKGIASNQAKRIKEMGAYSTPSINKAKDLQSGSIYGAEDYSSMSSAELIRNKFYDRLTASLAKTAKENPNNLVYMVMDKLFNSMPKWYEQIDQTYKLGTVDYLSRIGLTREELVRVSKFVDLNKDDIIEVPGTVEKMFRLKPLAASSVATETYMNYAAMPDFVKVIRSLPILGSNFFSFQYAIAAKTAKTAINNPAAFNKINFMLHEFSGLRTPEEKKALESKYSAYLNSPTVIKLFGTMNMDMKNYIPWVTMNMFNPSQKTYDNSTQGAILKALDKVPLLQTAPGQGLKDYWLQPMILLGTKQAPQGQFGQPVMPSFDNSGNFIGSSLAQKSLYSIRTMAGSMVPGTLSYLGLLFGWLPPWAIEAVPSYGFRSEAYAETGKSTIGAQTMDNGFEKALRTTLSRTGIPVASLNPNITSK